MARPSTWNDLSKWDKRGDQLVTWTSHNLMEHPEVAHHIIAAQLAAKKLGLMVDQDGIYERPSPETVEDRLQRAQRTWDATKQAYEAAEEFGLSKSESYRINEWARENGYPVLLVREEVSA